MVEVVRELETIWRMTPGTENIASSESGVLGMGSSSSNTTSTPTASGNTGVEGRPEISDRESF
jgi:hypothetical protein